MRGGKHNGGIGEEARVAFDGRLYDAAQSGDVRTLARMLLSLIEDAEGRVEAVENVAFGLVQRVEMAERMLAALPKAEDMAAIHAIIFGDERTGVVGLQIVAKQIQESVGRLDRAVSVLVAMMLAMMGVVIIMVAMVAWRIVTS